MVDAAVKDAVVRALVFLDVDHAGEIGAAGRREETPHLDGDLHVLCQLTDGGREFASRGKVIGEVLVGEVGHGEAGAVFEALHLEAVLVAQLTDKRMQLLDLADLVLELLALGSHEVVEPHDLEVREVRAFVDNLQ